MLKLTSMAIVAAVLVLSGCSDATGPQNGLELQQAQGEQTKPRGIRPPSADSTQRVASDPEHR